jgi:hypothetical protein
MPHPDDPAQPGRHQGKGHEPERRHFMAPAPADPDDPESVRAWLQHIADRVVARNEEVKVTIAHEGSDDGLTRTEYDIYVGPCPGRHFTPDDEPYPDGGEEDPPGPGN